MRMPRGAHSTARLRARSATPARAALAQQNPLRRLGEVQDVAEAVAYLCAPSGRFVTGETLVVDGGHQLWGELWMAGRPDGWEG